MLTILAAFLLAAPAVDPMIPIRAGKLRCGLPDVARKTCRTLTRYAVRPDGKLDVFVRGLPGDDGLSVTYHTTGAIENGGPCITITDGDVAAAAFDKSGVKLTGAALDRAREGMRAALARLLNRKSCSRDQGIDGVFNAEGYLGDERFPALDKQVMWVDPDAGYTLGPMPADVA